MFENKRIGIDARFYAEAGPGRYVKNIVKGLEDLDTRNDYVIFLRKKGYALYEPRNPRFRKVLADFPWYSFQEQIFFLRTLLNAKLDVFYVPHFNIPVLFPGKLVTAIPDLIMHSYSTVRGTSLPKFYFYFKKMVYLLVVWWAIKRSIRIIVPSLDVKNDFLTIYPKLKPEKLVLAYEGVDTDFIQHSENDVEILSKMGVKTAYFLYVSSMYEHKNVNSLIEAFEYLIAKKGFKGQLVLVGKKDRYSDEVEKLIRDKKLQDKILMPGQQRYITDEEISVLRMNAIAYVFPSLKEGFSLTPLEAQAVGLACIISDIPCHKEIYEDSVLYFNPQNISDIADKMWLVFSDVTSKESLIEKGYQQVKKYNWLDTSRITLNTLKLALKDA